MVEAVGIEQLAIHRTRRIALIRTTTLAQGAERCDFRFRRPDASDVGIPRASLTAHAVGAPIIFAALTAHLFLRHGGLPPIVVAGTFTAIVVALDALIVAWLIERSFAMFSSVLETWLPFALNFVSVFATGSLLWRGRSSRRGSSDPRPHRG